MIRNEFPYQKWMKLFDGIRFEYQRCYRRAGVTLTPNLGLRAYRPGVNSMPDDVASHSTRQVITTLAGAGNGGANQSILFFLPTPLCTGARTGVRLLVLKTVRVTG